MKNNLLKYYILAFYLCSSFVLFAGTDPGTTGDGTGGLEGETLVSSPGTIGNGDGGLEGGAAAPVASIDAYLWILALVVILYVFFKYRAIQNKRIQS